MNAEWKDILILTLIISNKTFTIKKQLIFISKLTFNPSYLRL